MKKLSLLILISLFAVNANANLVTASDSFSPVLIVDGSGSSTSLAITESGTITDVNVFIDFTKCDNPLYSNGTCGGSGYSYNSEIVFSLTSPGGTVVDLVRSNTYSGSTPGAQAQVLFDDDAATTVGGSTLLSGTFSPVGLLADFNGEDLLGNWMLSFADTVGADPLSLNAWRLDINTSTVPEPASMTLLALGLAGIGFSRKRKAA